MRTFALATLIAIAASVRMCDKEADRFCAWGTNATSIKAQVTSQIEDVIAQKDDTRQVINDEEEEDEFAQRLTKGNDVVTDRLDVHRKAEAN